MRAVTIKALEKCWSITQMPMDEDNKTIVARSIAYIGHILTKRESLVQSGEQTFELSKNPEFKLYLANFIRHLFVYPFNVPSDICIFDFTVCENIQELSQKWLHTRFQAIVPCIPDEHVYA
jgi:hypothetical protein